MISQPQQIELELPIKASVLKQANNLILILDLTKFYEAQDLCIIEKLNLKEITNKVRALCNDSASGISIVVACPRADNSRSKVLAKGLKTILECFAMGQIYTQTHLFTVFTQQKLMEQTKARLLHYFKQPNLSAVLHGTFLEIKQVPQLKTNAQVLITGGTRGIGKETAIQFAKKGTNLILTSRTVSAGPLEFAKSLKSAYHINAEVMALNLLSSESIQAFAAELEDRKIKLDCVVHNGAVGTKTCLEQTTPDTTPEQILIKVNTAGPMSLHQALESHQAITKESTRVIMVSSVGAVRGFSEMNQCDVASKAMLEPWLEGLSEQGWSISGVYPGATDTQMFQQSTTNKLKAANLYEKFCGKLPKAMIINPSLIGKAISMVYELVNPQKGQVARIMASCGLHLDYAPLASVN